MNAKEIRKWLQWNLSMDLEMHQSLIKQAKYTPVDNTTADLIVRFDARIKFIEYALAYTDPKKFEKWKRRHD